jgi:hypothetical protein
VVAQERLALRKVVPPSAQHEHIDAPVVVVVAPHHVQSAELRVQARLGGPIGERAVTVVGEQTHAAATVERRRHGVQVSIVVEVIDDEAAGRRDVVEAGRFRDIAETPDVLRRREDGRGDQMARGHRTRIGPEGPVARLSSHRASRSRV